MVLGSSLYILFLFINSVLLINSFFLLLALALVLVKKKKKNTHHLTLRVMDTMVFLSPKQTLHLY